MSEWINSKGLDALKVVLKSFMVALLAIYMAYIWVT